MKPSEIRIYTLWKPSRKPCFKKGKWLRARFTFRRGGRGDRSALLLDRSCIPYCGLKSRILENPSWSLESEAIGSSPKTLRLSQHQSTFCKRCGARSEQCSSEGDPVFPSIRAFPRTLPPAPNRWRRGPQTHLQPGAKRDQGQPQDARPLAPAEAVT